MANKRWDERPVERDDETGRRRVRVRGAKYDRMAGGVELWSLPVFAYVDFGEAVEGQDEDDYAREPRRRPGWFEEVVRLAAGSDEESRQVAMLYLATAPDAFFEHKGGAPITDTHVIARKVRKVARARPRRHLSLDGFEGRSSSIDDPTAREAIGHVRATSALDLLTLPQRRRTWLHLAKGWTLEKIAEADGVTRQSVHESIQQAIATNRADARARARVVAAARTGELREGPLTGC